MYELTQLKKKRKEKKQTKHNSISWHGNKQVKRQITVLWFYEGLCTEPFFGYEKQLPGISSGCWAIAQR